VLKRSTMLMAALSLVTLLTACGGGGGGGAGGTGVSGSNYSIVIPSKLASNPATGSPNFPAAVSDYGTGSVSIAASTESGYEINYYSGTSPVFNLFSTAHLDASVLTAWASGWNGLGVTISIIDDFNTASATIERRSPTITREKDVDYGQYGKVRSTHSMIYSWNDIFTHGDLVSNIAGGDYDGQRLTVQTAFTVYSDTRTGCTTLRPANSVWLSTRNCDSSYYLNTYAWPAPLKFLDLSYRKVAGFAKSANVVNNNVNLSDSQNPLKTVADIQGHLQNSAYLGVINLSLGSDIPTSGKTLDQVMSQVSRFPLSRAEAVITVAAGNGGAPCATQDLNGCNSLAVAMAYQPATGGSTIVVGATSGSGSSENIATYSTRAGILAQRFVLAPGYQGDQGIVGTSFAAPRVAGIAAILKQRYPSLTSNQIASTILLSASKDINNDGIDDFTGVSPIYGHGKASLTRALALAGAL
jgi:hypothetical protein